MTCCGDRVDVARLGVLFDVVEVNKAFAFAANDGVDIDLVLEIARPKARAIEGAVEMRVKLHIAPTGFFGL